MAYNREWSEFHRSEEVLNYLVQSLDFLVRSLAKGESSRIPGYDHVGIALQNFSAQTLLLVYDDLEQRGVFDKQIDHDGNPETDSITRREAYASFFSKALWKHPYRNHVTNIANGYAFAIYSINRMLQILDPQKAMSKEEGLKYLYEALGLLPSWTVFQEKTPEFDIRKVSDKGIEFERKGYAANYGAGPPVRWLDLIEDETAKEELKRKMIQRVRARSYFSVPSNDGEGYRALRNEPFISFRNRPYPNDICRGRLQEAAFLRSPASIRRAQLYLKSSTAARSWIPTYVRARKYPK